jgi:Domain of unknown function (DUF3291)
MRARGRTMAKYQIAQVNIGRIKGPLDGPLMVGFMSRLDEINALADRSPGFVWRLQTNAGNATYFRPYEHDDQILLNMSVWETVEALKHYVYRTVHAELLRSATNGLKNSRACIWHCGGYRRATFRELMKRRSGSPT